MTNLFRCFDYDEDGFVEKMEFLDGIERIKGYIEGSKTQLELKERKAGVAWFNACEGVEKEGRDSYMPPKVFHAYVPQYLCDLFFRADYSGGGPGDTEYCDTVILGKCIFFGSKMYFVFRAKLQ